MNVIDHIIEQNTKFSPIDFTGGNIQLSVSKHTKLLTIKLVLYFGFSSTRNSIARDFEIDEADIEQFARALLERSKIYQESLKPKNILSYESVRSDYEIVRSDSSDTVVRNDSYAFVRNNSSDTVVRNNSNGSGLGGSGIGGSVSDNLESSSPHSDKGTPEIKKPTLYVPTGEEFLEVWNENAQAVGLRAIKTMSPARHKMLKTRIANNENFLDELLECLVLAGKSQLIQQGTWFGVDWLLKNDTNYVKVLEGNYDNR